MLRRKTKSLKHSSDLNEDVEINVELSPQRKRTFLPQKQQPTTNDWQRCGDSFSGLDPLPERGKKRKRPCISAPQQKVTEKNLNPSLSVEEFDSGDNEIVWSSSDEEQSGRRCKSPPQQKVRRQILATSSKTAWPETLLLHNNRGKSKKKTSNDREKSWHHYKNAVLLTQSPQPEKDEVNNFDVEDFDDSDQNSKIPIQHDIQKSTTIDAFSSDEESPDVDNKLPSSPQADEQGSEPCSRSDVDIATWSSANFSDECTGATGGGRKTSEWLQALQMTTPTKNQNNSIPSSQLDTNNPFDSAKKKRRHKYKGDGLALKMSRIISREKSAMNVWSYRQSELPNENKNILTACVHSCSCKVGMVITLCSLGTLSSQNEWKSTNAGSYQTILFSRSILEILKLQAGSVIRIFPPWQELLMPQTGEKVLLCTYFCQLVESASHIWNTMDHPGIDPSRIICRSFEWSCPCSTSDANAPLRYCPASSCPVLTKCPKIQTAASSEVSNNKQISKPSSSLNIVGLTTAESATGGASTILNSIQAAPTTFQQGLCFQAMVLRVFCAHNPAMLNTKRYRQTVQSWSVLVEDSQGTVCIVQIPERKESSKNSLTQLIQSAEGTTWNFFGLRVFSRSNRHKDPALFSMIDEAWICPSHQNESPKSSGESDHVIAAQVKPGFCYVTGPSDDVGVQSGVLPDRNTCSQNESASKPKIPLQVSTLLEIKKQLLQDNNATRMRFTFIAKVFYLRTKPKQSQPESQPGVGANAKIILFLSDPSINGESFTHMAIHCLPSCYLPLELISNSKDPGPVLALMRYVLFEQDMIAFADGYTTIWPWPPPLYMQQMVPSVSKELLKKCSKLLFPLQSLQDDSECNSLFKVQGVIYSVDHKTAVTWETCPYCDEEQLAFRQDEQQQRCLVCLNCEVQVEESVTHINLEVIIRCLSLPGYCEVRVNLLQPTVESLLPEGDHKDGYDISAVLGQQVGPLSCLLKKRSTNKQQQVFYLEEIQQL